MFEFNLNTYMRKTLKVVEFNDSRTEFLLVNNALYYHNKEQWEDACSCNSLNNEKTDN